MKIRLTQSLGNSGFQTSGHQKGMKNDGLAKTLVFASGDGP